MKCCEAFFLVTLLLIQSCSGPQYRFERIDDGRMNSVPLKFTGIQGARDGASVQAQALFREGQDAASINLILYLGPPAECRSGMYRATIGGLTTEGAVECASLSYLGGQNAQPSVGGIFILKDAQNRPAYRVTIPPTVMTRRVVP